MASTAAGTDLPNALDYSYQLRGQPSQAPSPHMISFPFDSIGGRTYSMDVFPLAAPRADAFRWSIVVDSLRPEDHRARRPARVAYMRAALRGALRTPGGDDHPEPERLFQALVATLLCEQWGRRERLSAPCSSSDPPVVLADGEAQWRGAPCAATSPSNGLPRRSLTSRTARDGVGALAGAARDALQISHGIMPISGTAAAADPPCGRPKSFQLLSFFISFQKTYG